MQSRRLGFRSTLIRDESLLDDYSATWTYERMLVLVSSDASSHNPCHGLERIRSRCEYSSDYSSNATRRRVSACRQDIICLSREERPAALTTRKSRKRRIDLADASSSLSRHTYRFIGGAD